MTKDCYSMHLLTTILGLHRCLTIYFDDDTDVNDYLRFPKYALIFFSPIKEKKL